MSPKPITVDAEALGTSVLALLAASGKTWLSDHVEVLPIHGGRIRLSGEFMKLWCGTTGPTEELDAWLRDHGAEIVPGTDYHGGWDVRRAGEQKMVGQMELL